MRGGVVDVLRSVMLMILGPILVTAALLWWVLRTPTSGRGKTKGYDWNRRHTMWSRWRARRAFPNGR
jgi:hypothetical protein